MRKAEEIRNGIRHRGPIPVPDAAACCVGFRRTKNETQSLDNKQNHLARGLGPRVKWFCGKDEVFHEKKFRKVFERWGGGGRKSFYRKFSALNIRIPNPVPDADACCVGFRRTKTEPQSLDNKQNHLARGLGPRVKWFCGKDEVALEKV